MFGSAVFSKIIIIVDVKCPTIRGPIVIVIPRGPSSTGPIVIGLCVILHKCYVVVIISANPSEPGVPGK